MEHADGESAGLYVPTRAEAAADHVAAEVALVLLTFARHPRFASIAARVAVAPDPREAAEAEAQSLATKGGRREVLIHLLLAMATSPSPAYAEYRLRNTAVVAVWAEDNRTQALSRQRLRDRRDGLALSALRAARFVTGECVECGDPLSDRYEHLGGSRKRRRRQFCSAHESLENHWGGKYKAQIEEAFRVASGRNRVRLHRRHGTAVT